MTALALKQDKSGLDIDFRGNHLIIDPSGCVYWPDEDTLVVSDLHLEKGSSLATRGILVPPYDTDATLDHLAEKLTSWQPKRVISLGDSFHDDGASTRLTGPSRARLMQMMKRRDWVWICGNHDPSPPESLGGMHASELYLGTLMFRHEPLMEFVPGEIAGHLHPCAKIRRRGKSVRRRCVAGDGNRMILPAFGAYTGGLDLKDPAYQGLFQQTSLKAWMLGLQNIYEIGADQLFG